MSKAFQMKDGSEGGGGGEDGGKEGDGTVTSSGATQYDMSSFLSGQ